jgi:hypothetical protein
MKKGVYRDHPVRGAIGTVVKLTVALCAAGIALSSCSPSEQASSTAGTAAAEHPDFSGVWLGFAATPAGRLGPATPPLSEKGKAMVQAFEDQYGKDAPESGAYCVPDGMPGVMTSLAGYPIEFVQKPGKLVTISEIENQVRRIYLDGREHPGDYPATRSGHSVGHWEGDTLVIDSVDFLDWPSRRFPRSSDAHIVERIHKTTRSQIDVENTPFISEKPLNDDVLVDEITVTDPVFTEPAKITVYYQPISDDATLEYDCPVSVWQDALDAHAVQKRPAK